MTSEKDYPLTVSRFIRSRLQGTLCVLWIAMHMYYLFYIPFSLDELCILHVTIGALIVSLTYIADALENKKIVVLLYQASIFLILVYSAFYFFANYENIIDRVGRPSFKDIISGAILIIALLLLVARSWGWLIPAIITGTLFYASFGQHLWGVLFHTGIDLQRLIGYSCTFFSGIFGSLTTLSASTIIHFLIFGALLQACGGAEFIEKMSYIIGARYRSGAAQTAIYSSAFVGMISGSTAANVAVTGAFTIPLMKKNGYSPAFAGAVEAVASTGGQIMPPIMGVTAFLMASMMGRPYADVAIAAFLPAVLYFFALSFGVFVETRKQNIYPKRRPEDMPPFTALDIFKDHGLLLLPIVLLTWRIIAGASPARAVMSGNLLLLGVALFQTLMESRKRGGEIKTAVAELARKVYESLVTGGMEAAKLAIIIAGMGIIIEMLTVTGFGQRLSYTMVDMAGGSAFLLVCLVGALTIFFGMGMPTPGAYLLAVLLSSPALVQLGFTELSVHFFVFYFAIISAVTPPVAIAVLVAVGISGANYLECAKRSLMLAIPGFIMPFYFLYCPEILLLQKAPLMAVFYNCTLLIAMAGLTIAFEGHYFTKLSLVVRFLLLAGVLSVFFPEAWSSAAGTALILMLMIANYFNSKKGFNNEAPSLNDV